MPPPPPRQQDVSHSREQLGVVVGHRRHQLLSSVVQEAGERGVPVLRECDLVKLCPHLHTDQGDEDVQRRVQLRQTYREGGKTSEL